MKLPFNIIPLESSKSSGWMCWVNGIIIFLALFFVTGALIFQGTIQNWHHQTRHGFSVSLPPEDRKASNMDFANQTKVLDLLKSNPAVRNYHVLSKSTIHATTDLTYNDHLARTPTPIVIDVETHPTMIIDFSKITAEISSLYPGATVSQNREWQEGLLTLASGIYKLGLFLTALVCFITLSIISFSTYTGLMIHLDIVRALIQMGANRNFIANRFQLHALTTTGISSLIGVGLGLIAVIICLALSLQADSWPRLTIQYGQVILAIFGIPLFLMFLTVITSQLTVFVVLRRLKLC
ncbi:MAG: hypothetical protein H6849_04925 [Alphaproteobacteria bacterium]|nr:MAG: hypothetical protein H6849_04925 [Alphaproteobacteria bacterium]